MEKITRRLKALSLLKSIPLDLIDSLPSREVKKILSEVNLTGYNTKERIKELILKLKTDSLIPDYSLFLKKEYTENLCTLLKTELNTAESNSIFNVMANSEETNSLITVQSEIE